MSTTKRFHYITEIYYIKKHNILNLYNKRIGRKNSARTRNYEHYMRKISSLDLLFSYSLRLVHKIRIYSRCWLRFYVLET